MSCFVQVHLQLIPTIDSKIQVTANTQHVNDFMSISLEQQWFDLSVITVIKKELLTGTKGEIKRRI